MLKLPYSPLYSFFALPRGRLLKVHAEPCMYAPGYLQSNKPRWPAATAGVPVVPADRVERLRDAIEGECDGLAIDEQHARAILQYVDGVETSVKVNDKTDRCWAPLQGLCKWPDCADANDRCTYGAQSNG